MKTEQQTERETRLQEQAREIRLLMLDMIQKTGGGHYGGSLSVIDILPRIVQHFSLGDRYSNGPIF